MFDRASAVAAEGDGRFTASADASWAQGPGLYGGMPLAWLTRAFEQTADRPLRTLTAHFVRPVQPGTQRVRVEVVRRGGHVTTLRGEVADDQGPSVVALATLAAAKDGPELPGDAPPTVPPFADTVGLPGRLPGTPAFTAHVDHRYLLGGAPWSGGPEAHIGGWCRFREPGAPCPALLAALLDAWPPPVMVTMTAPHVATTVDVTLHLLGLPSPGPHDPYLYACRAGWAEGGYAEDHGQLWDHTGRLVGRVRQWRSILSVREGP